MVERFFPADLVCVCVLRIKLCNLVQSSSRRLHPVSCWRLSFLFFFFFLLGLFTLVISVSHSLPVLAPTARSILGFLTLSQKTGRERFRPLHCCELQHDLGGEQATPHHPLGSARPADQLAAPPRGAPIRYQVATLQAACSTQSQLSPQFVRLSLATSAFKPQPGIGHQSIHVTCSVRIPSHGLERHTTYSDRGLSQRLRPCQFEYDPIPTHPILMDTSGSR